MIVTGPSLLTPGTQAECGDVMVFGPGQGQGLVSGYNPSAHPHLYGQSG